MALQLINIGNIADDGTGDDLRTAFSKINSNTTELASVIGATASVSSAPNTLVLRDANSDIYANKIFFKNSFPNLASLPSASTYPGMFVHVVGKGAYYSNGAFWKAIPTWNDSTVVTDAVLRWNGTEFVTTDPGVKTFNGRSGAVTLTSADIATAMASGVLIDAGGRISVDSVGNMTFGTSASLGVTGFIKLPSGTTAQRPILPSLGMLRYNNETNTFEGYVGPGSGSSWRSIGPLGSAPTTFTDITVSGTATVNNLIGITGINGPIGTTSPAAGTFTTLTGTGAATFSNIATLNSNTVATALGTGALVVSGTGGASIGGNLYVGGTVYYNGLTITGTTQSTDPSNGALVVPGGAGIGKNLNVGGDLDVTGTIKSSFFDYTTYAASPTPAAIKSRSIHGFNAYSSTDFPGNYYTGLTVKGDVVGAQLAICWDTEEDGTRTKVYVRANDDTSNTAAWSTWEQVLTKSASFVLGPSQGGIGLTSFTQFGVMYASSTSALATGGDLTFTPSTKALVCGGNISAYSDARLKKNVKIIDHALEKVNQLNGYTFDRIDLDTGRQTGVIAQEVLAVLPEAVDKNSDGMHTVAYGNMVGLLIESIKELNQQVAILRAELAQLQNNNRH
jgi:hypothetical protein